METSTQAERQAMARVFQQFDEDNSGTMDVAELSGALEHLGIYVEEDQLSELVHQVEVNEQNEIFLDGFANLISLLKGAARYQLVGSSLRTKSGEYLQKALNTKLLSSDAIWRFFFDYSVMLTAYVLSIIIILDSVLPVPTAALVIESVAAGVFLCDIIVSAFTYRDRDDLAYTVHYYATGWMAADVLATIPWGIILPEPASLVLRHANWVLKMLKAPYMWRNSDKSVMTEQYINYHFKVLPISALLGLFGFMVHVFTVLFVEIKRSRGEPEFTYDQSLYFVMQTLCTVGFGSPQSVFDTTEQLYACLVLLGAIFCNGYIIATFVTILQRADIHQDRRGKLRETLAVLEHFSMPPALQDEVLQFQDHLLGHSLSSAYASVVEGLPQEMRNNIDVAVKLRMVDTAPFLASLHDLLRIAIAKELVNAVAKPEQNLFVQGEPCRNMIFISHGLVDLIHRGGVQHTKLRTGQYFGVSALLAREIEIPREDPNKNNETSDLSHDEVVVQGENNNHHHENTESNTNNNDNKNNNSNSHQTAPENEAAEDSNNTNNADDGGARRTKTRTIFAKHTVSAKAVSYCDLWTLRGGTVIAMSKRFVQLRNLILRLHEEFEINPMIFSCILPPELPTASSARNNNNNVYNNDNSNNNSDQNAINGAARVENSDLMSNNNENLGDNQQQQQQQHHSAPTPFTVGLDANNRRQQQRQQEQQQQQQQQQFDLMNINSQHPHRSPPNADASLGATSGDFQQTTTEVFLDTDDHQLPKEDAPSSPHVHDNNTNQNENNNDDDQNSVTKNIKNNHTSNSLERQETKEEEGEEHPSPKPIATTTTATNRVTEETTSDVVNMNADDIIALYHGFEFEDEDEDDENNQSTSSTSPLLSSSTNKRQRRRSSNINNNASNDNSNSYIQTIDSLPTHVRVHSLTERLHICHARMKVLLGALQQQQQNQQQHQQQQ